MRRLRLLVFVLAAIGIGCSTAHASLVSLNFDFTASDFSAIANPALIPPLDPVIGSVSLTFDNSAAIPDTTSGFSFTSNLTAASPIGYSYNPAGDAITIGGIDSGVTGINPGVDDFWISFGNVSTMTRPDVFLSYTSAAFPRPDLIVFSANRIELTPVPEPTAVSLLALGLTGAALRGRRRRCAASPD